MILKEFTRPHGPYMKQDGERSLRTRHQFLRRTDVDTGHSLFLVDSHAGQYTATPGKSVKSDERTRGWLHGYYHHYRQRQGVASK